MRCPRCKGKFKPAESFLGGPSPTWYKCVNCNTYYCSYRPMKHQYAVHKDVHKIIGNFGGYGTGKTTTSEYEMMKHIFITPNANIIAGANVQSQYEQTLKRFFEMEIPAAFVRDYSSQKQHMDFVNGARLMWRPFDDPDKIRSYTISMAVLLEASEIKGDTYTQAKTRLRSLAATIPERDANGEIVYEEIDGEMVPKVKFDWRRMIVESNPDAGWIRNEVLLKSEIIHQYKTNWNYQRDPESLNPNIASHVAASTVNPYLPKGFLDDLRRSNPDWWVRRYLEGSFQYSEGLVYPSAPNTVVDPFPIPKDWKRLIAFDYGIADLAAFVWAAVNPITGVIFVYQVKTARDRNVEQLAQMYKLGSHDIPDGGLYGQPLIDPKSGPKRDYNLRSLSDQFLDHGISFKAGQIDVNARIYRLNTYIESGKLKIFSTCTHLLEELRDYKFKERTLTDMDRKISGPVDKNNHAINALEWITMELPHDPRQVLGEVYGKDGNRIKYPGEEAQTPWQFAEDEDFKNKEATRWWR